jgi:transcription elongation GreA/GreB family factor
MPLAQALMGYGKDDEVEIPAGGKTRRVTIVNIERSGPKRVQA